MQLITAILFLVSLSPCWCQRPFYAGLKPIGYPDVTSPQKNSTPEDLPAQLNGDESYANMLDKLPFDHQPFWYLNKKQYAELMKNPQTYPHRPSVFNDNV